MATTKWGHTLICAQMSVCPHLVVAILEEDRLTPIAARRHMVREAGNHDARKAGHRRSLAQTEQKGNM